MSIIVDGQKIAERVYDRIRAHLDGAKKKPLLGVVLVGDHAPSQLYVRKKKEAAQRVGIDFFLATFPEHISQDALCEQMKKIQNENDFDGFIVQLPLPRHINTEQVVNTIRPENDVDFLSDAALGSLVSGSFQKDRVPPTPGAIIEILDHYNIPLQGTAITIIGAGRLVGKPLTNMLLHEGATVSVVQKETPDISFYTRNAKIIISATGVHGVLTKEMVSKECIIIDAGISVENGVASGDIDVALFQDIAAIITPTPGGVGPITVAKLLENTAL